MKDKIIKELGKPKSYIGQYGRTMGISSKKFGEVLRKNGVYDQIYGNKSFGDLFADFDVELEEMFYEYNSLINILDRYLWTK